MKMDLAAYGLVRAENAPLELAHAARGIPTYSRGKLAAFVMVDALDEEWASKHRWYLKVTADKRYAARSIKLPREGGGKVDATEFLHRRVLGLDRDDRRQTDHMDGDTLNCQRRNLRACTPAQNQQNRQRGNRGSTSKHRGVCWHKGHRRWLAYARVNGEFHRLGEFTDEQEAADAAAAFRREHMPFSNN